MSDNATARIHDDYGYITKNQADFETEIREIRASSEMRGEVPAEDLSVRHIQPMDYLSDDLVKSLPYDAMQDTTSENGTALMVVQGPEGFEHDAACLRDTGYVGLIQTAVGLAGPGIKRLWNRSRDLFVDSINEFLKSNKANMKVFTSCDKVSGVFSQSYMEMPIPELYDISTEEMGKKLGTPQFVGGELNHRVTSCQWELPDIHEKVMAAYHDAVKSSMFNLDFEPTVRLVSSDTGNASAMLLPMLTGNHAAAFPLGNGVRIRHDVRKLGRGTTGCGINDFRDQASNLLPRFMDSMDALKKMSQTEVEYTQNAFIAACNYAFGESLPLKLASLALDSFMEISEGAPCSMHDIYLGICDIATEAKKNNASLDRRIQIDDALARLLTYRGNWSDFDLAGTVAWNGKRAQ